MLQHLKLARLLLSYFRAVLSRLLYSFSAFWAAFFNLAAPDSFLQLFMASASHDGAMVKEMAAEVYAGELTPLQKHAALFDRNHDGVIYPWETYQGFRAIGAGIGLSTVASIFINGFLAGKTKESACPSPLFPIYVKNIQKAKHGSDSGVHDKDGRFVQEKFEDIFKKHAHTHPDTLTEKELSELLKANREPNDSSGGND